jgi:Sulfotransferase family
MNQRSNRVAESAYTGTEGRSVHPPFPFIVARGRSGTTLLRAMFDSHPDMAVPPESHFLVTMGLRRRRFERDGGLDVDRFVEDLTREYGFRRWALDPKAVRQRLSGTHAATYADAMRDVFALYAEEHGKTRYAEKTPMNVMHIPFLARVFPEARFIHLIRDGRDVALSYLDTDFGVESVGESAIYWRRFVRKGRRDGERLGLRYREVRYEELLADPEHILRSLCAFMELPYDSAMLTYHRQADRILETTSHREHHESLRLPPTRGLRDWRTQMNDRSLALFEALAGDLLDQVGYERGAEAIPASIRLKAAGVRITTFARRLQRRAAKGVRGLRPTPRRRSPSQPVSAAANGAVSTRRSP